MPPVKPSIMENGPVISRGAKQLGWELPKLFTMTLEAMQASEDIIEEEMADEI